MLAVGTGTTQREGPRLTKVICSHKGQSTKKVLPIVVGWSDHAQ